MLDDLGGDPQRHDSVTVHPRRSCLGLEVGVVDGLGAVLGLDDVGGRRQCSADVSRFQVPVDEHVSFQMNPGGIVFERVLRVEHADNGLVVDEDELGTGDGSFRALGDDDGNRLAGVANQIGRQHRSLDDGHPETARLFADHVVRHVCGGQHGHDPRSGLGLARVDRRDSRRRLDGADQLGVEHGRGVAVGRILERSGDLVGELAVDGALPDHRRRRLLPLGHPLGHPAGSGS